MLVLLYLCAVVLANLLVATFGPPATIPVAFLLIGLTLTTRDRIHRLWEGRHLKLKMAALIGSGGLLSWGINNDAARIALASFVAFVVSEAADSLIYSRLRTREWFTRSNVSNVVAAALDSLLFLTIAFGALLPWIVVGQFLAKTIGGLLWSMILRPSRRAVTATSVLVVLVWATPSHAQIVNVGVGSSFSERGVTPIAEVFASTPELLNRLRANGVVSFSEDSDPVYLAKVSYALSASQSHAAGVEVGFDFLPFRDYEPEPLLSVFSSVVLRDRLRLFFAVSAEPQNDWDWVAVVKLDMNLLFRR